MVSLWNRGQNRQEIQPGDRIAQLVFLQCCAAAPIVENFEPRTRQRRLRPYWFA